MAPRKDNCISFMIKAYNAKRSVLQPLVGDAHRIELLKCMVTVAQ